MTRPPATYTVLTPNIEPSTMARLLSLHDIERGVLVCHPVPPSPRANHLAHDVLHALGKRPWTHSWPRAQAAVDRELRRWLNAERISDLVLVRADLFKPDALEHIATVAASSGARTWLIFDNAQQRRATNDALKALPKARVDIAPCAEKPSNPPERPSKPWPSSPWVARAVAATTFTRCAFQDVDAHMRKAYSTAESWLRRHKRLEPHALRRFLEALTRAPDARHRHARVMGASSALLVSGIAAEIHDLPTPPDTAATQTAHQEAQIRRHSNPTAAALHALSILTDLDEMTIRGLSLDQVGDAPGGVSLSGYVLTGAAAGAFRAHYDLMTARPDPLTNRLFTPSQIRVHKGPWGSGPPANGRAIDIRLAALDDSVDLSRPSSELGTSFPPCAPTLTHEAALIVRLLRLTPTRALPLKGEIETQAAHRLESIGAVRSNDDRVFATEDLRFSHYLTNATRYLTERA